MIPRKLDRIPHSSEVTVPMLRRQYLRREHRDGKRQVKIRQAQFADYRTNLNGGRDPESGAGSRKTIRLADLQPGAQVSGAESAGRVDGNQSKRKRKKGGAVSQDSSTLSRKRGVGDDDLLS